MTIHSSYLVYPEGDVQEAPVNLGINQLVDINGYPLQIPLKDIRVIAYRVFRIAHKETIGEHNTYFHLELVKPVELMEFAE